MALIDTLGKSRHYVGVRLTTKENTYLEMYKKQYKKETGEETNTASILRTALFQYLEQELKIKPQK